ncbi:E3 ubiquitin-protein ligase rnf146-like [Scleropages formosus]|uniref:E3 ubiquitin-protein ligase n=1 Tax=Scleropages formosus TaxID=113540 RepID=A0A8C9TMW8_SCLFO|nr:E3 ubiquitin-protein ligase rnf146-like [Scleropages formosus]
MMAGCSEVDHSVNSLASGRKGGGDVRLSPSGPTPVVPECAICLQTCVHAVQLPCTHVFCFLCVKGASWQSKRCALCRREVPDDFLERPTLLSPEELKMAGRDQGEYAWYYEGRNGWWQYDERTSRELEDAFSKGKKSTEMLIAGFLYVADLENMVQYRRNEHGRRRKMKRDVVGIPKKGVAGLRLDTETASQVRESSADGADTPGLQGSGVGPRPAQVRPPTSLGAQSINPSASRADASTSLESSFSQLHIGHSEARDQVRYGEGEEEAGEGLNSPSRLSSTPNTSVNESASESDSEEEEERENEEGQQEGAWSSRQRLRFMVNLDHMHLRENQTERSPPGGAPTTSSSSASSRRPDGQCSVTEV